MIPKYIALSPIGDHKYETIPAFLEALRNQDPPPDDIVFCFDVDTALNPEEYGVTVRYSPELSVGRGILERICSAREILRKHFIYHPKDYQFGLWVDCDIVVPPNLFRTLYEKMEEENALVVVNKYQGRVHGDEKRMWCGSGVMLTHKIACMVSQFYLGKVPREDGRLTNLSEDFMFFAGIDQGRYFLKQWTGRSGRVCEEFVEVEHRWKKR